MLGVGFSWEILKNHPARSVALATKAEPRIGGCHSELEAVPKQRLHSGSCQLEALPCARHLPPPRVTGWDFGTLELGIMGTPNDQAVLQAIFNPDTPFGDVVALDLEEAEEGDEGEPLTLVATPL